MKPIQSVVVLLLAVVLGVVAAQWLGPSRCASTAR